MLRPLVCLAGNIAFLLKSRRIAKDPKKIIIMRSGGIGDVLMSTPLVKAVRLRYPHARITYLVGQFSQEAIKGNPNVDEVMTYPDEIIFKQDRPAVDKLIAKIKAEEFDLAFVLDKAWQWNVLAWMAKIPCRLGFDRGGEGFALTKSVPFKGKKYELEYYRDLASLVCEDVPKGMNFYPTKKDDQKAALLIKTHHLHPKKIVVLIPGGAKNPGQELAQKRWPAESYGKLADALLKMHCSVILLGGKNDAGIIKEAQSAMEKKALAIAGSLSLAQSASLLKHAHLVITHDSGPMHLSAAMGAPLIALFGPTDPKRFAPPSATVITNPGEKPTYDLYGGYDRTKNPLAGVPVETVLNAARKAIK